MQHRQQPLWLAWAANQLTPCFTPWQELSKYAPLQLKSAPPSQPLGAQPVSQGTNSSTKSALNCLQTAITSMPTVSALNASQDSPPTQMVNAFRQTPTLVQPVKSHPTEFAFQSKWQSPTVWVTPPLKANAIDVSKEKSHLAMDFHVLSEPSLTNQALSPVHRTRAEWLTEETRQIHWETAWQWMCSVQIRDQTVSVFHARTESMPTATDCATKWSFLMHATDWMASSMIQFISLFYAKPITSYWLLLFFMHMMF